MIPDKDRSDLSENGDISLKTAWPIVFAGGFLGLILSWSVLSGDDSGRVNLFYLLVVYLLFPIFSLLISCMTLVFGKGVNLARIVSGFPVWFSHRRSLLRKIHQYKIEKYWLFFQSQLSALAYSVASLFVLFLLLLATDINFVWRSTLLSAEDIYPLLQAVAAPWTFWDKAQPSFALLEATRDSRLDVLSGGKAVNYGLWWQFVLAVQLFYCVILRGVLLLFSFLWIRKKIVNDIEVKLCEALSRNDKDTTALLSYKELIFKLPDGLMINNWAGIDLTLINEILVSQPSSDNLIKAGPLATEVEQRIAERWQGKQLVVVKSWEPPMGELMDFLENGKGFIFPVDYSETSVKPVKLMHLQEWRRFINNMNSWDVFIPVELLPDDFSIAESVDGAGVDHLIVGDKNG